MSHLPPTIWWIRRDLRLNDNLALSAALASSPLVIPVFILDPEVLDSRYHHAASKRKTFLFNGLRQLDADLRRHGSHLIVRHGRALDALSDLVAETQATQIVAAEDFGTYGALRDARICGHLPLTLVNDQVVHHPATVLKANGQPYTVFTPFRRAWQALAPPIDRLQPADGMNLHTPAEIASHDLPDAPAPMHFLPGEGHARQALLAFAAGPGAPIDSYSEGRDRLDYDGTSALSPYLRFGMLSARQAVAAARRAMADASAAVARTGAQAWLNELIWREFYVAILYHFPDVRQRAFRPALRDIAWSNDEQAFAAWCQGCTGYPVVDAAMRQLAATGWMHNRARMIVASFLVKDLLIDWRWGEAWFMQHLVDGDPAPNNGGWQWAAGGGTDAAPYFRIFNPSAQAARYDPYGAFVRAWLPALRRVPDAFVHEPWRMPVHVQRDAQCRVGKDYPAPIVDHSVARQRALAAYGKAKS